MADRGDLLALAPLEEVVERVPDVPGPAAAAIVGVGVEGLEVAAKLGGGGVMTGQEVDPELQVVVVATGQPEDFLGLTDLGGEVALVADGDPFALAAPVGHRQSVRANHANRREEDPEGRGSVVRIGEQQIFLREVVGALDPDLAAELAQEPDPFALCEGPLPCDSGWPPSAAMASRNPNAWRFWTGT